MALWKRWAWRWPVAFALFALMFTSMAAWWTTQHQFTHNNVVTVSGEGVCACCVLHETASASPALRIIERGATNVIHLNFSGFSVALHHYFAGGITVTAKGVLRTNDGRVILDTHSLEANGVGIH